MVQKKNLCQKSKELNYILLNLKSAISENLLGTIVK